MKRLLLLSLFLVFLCSCMQGDKIDNPENTNESVLLDNYLQMDLPQLKKKYQRLYYAEWGNLTETSNNDAVYILSDEQNKEKIQRDVYMVVEVHGKLLFHTIGTFDKMVIQNGSLILKDIDGDDVDEIIVYIEITGNGVTLTHIYKVENQEIKLFSDLSECDTGYSSEFIEGCKLVISNRFTNYKYSLDVSDMFTDDFFDEKGKAVTDETIELSTFISCNAIEKMGVYELHCIQNVSLLGYIGKAETTLKYNPIIGDFIVVESKFLQN